MCCCGKPTINGERGYRWNNPDAEPTVFPINPPAVQEGETILYDEPGRCGGLDSHSHHYRVVLSHGTLWLLVRHGGGDERIYLSCTKTLLEPLAKLDSNGRYWILNALHHGQSRAAFDAREREHSKWVHAVSEKRVKTRKQRGCVKVWIEPKITGHGIHA